MRQYQTRHDATPLDLDLLDFEKGGGLVTVVAQDAISGMVLMVEPGAYHPEIGGARTEFMLQITETGCSPLAEFPLLLSVAS